MNENTPDILFDLLEKRAVYGLDEAERKQLEVLLEKFDDDASFDHTVAAIAMLDIDDEPMPAHLMSKIIADAGKVMDAPKETARLVETQPVTRPAETGSSGNFWNWMGWAVAAAACVALAINIGLTRFGGSGGPGIAGGPTPTPAATPMLEKLTDAQMRLRLMETSPDLVKASWTDGNMKDVKGVTGDAVWSDAKQAGYLHFHGLPANDRNQYVYQLWIFDETQDEKTPIDGGVFNVDSNGDVVIPITAKLKAKNPKMFAVTMEKPGGVVVSKREKIPVLGKVSI